MFLSHFSTVFFYFNHPIKYYLNIVQTILLNCNTFMEKAANSSLNKLSLFYFGKDVTAHIIMMVFLCHPAQRPEVHSSH